MAKARAHRGAASYSRVVHRTAPGKLSHLVALWAFWALLLANAGVIVWLWWNGGNVTRVHSTADVLNSIGRITGLLSAYTALIQLVLLARLPVLEWVAPFDRLTVWHRWNGMLTLYLVLAHVVFITIGYALLDRLSIPSEISSLLTNYPGMVTATFGTALFIIVVISSVVIARRKLPYEAWYAIHITIYAGIALAWFHQIPTGNELVLNHGAQVYWNSLYLVTVVLILLFRVVQPMVHVLWYRMRVADVTVEGPNVVSLSITGKHLDRLPVQPGQFFFWRFLTWNRFWEAHPFSLSAAPNGRSLRITIKDLGDFSRHAGEIRPGTRVITEGPFGTFTAARLRRDRVALMAGGIGITPIRALIEGMQADHLTVIYRVLREEDLIFRDELDSLVRERGISIHYVVGDHTVAGGEHLMSPEHLCEMVPDLPERDIYICGPPGMVRFLEGNVLRAGVPRRHIHVERFALS